MRKRMRASSPLTAEYINNKRTTKQPRIIPVSKFSKRTLNLDKEIGGYSKFSINLEFTYSFFLSLSA